MKKASRWILTGAALWVAAILALAYDGASRALSGGQSAAWPITEFQAEAVGPESSRPFSLADMKGRVWVAGFVFARCSGPCPVISAEMAELQDLLPEEAGLLTVTVDPEHDDRDVLARYAKSYGARQGRWHFLRLSKKGLYDLAYEGFKLPLAEDPSAPEGRRVTHSTKLALIDQEGTLRGYYASGSEAARTALRRDVRRLLAGGPRT